MGGDDDDASAGLAAQGVEDVRGRRVVDRRGGVVEKEHGRVVEKSAGEGEALGLPAGELALGDSPVEVGQLLDSRMRWQLSQHDELDVVATEHAELFDAIAHRDVDRVLELATHHLSTSRQQHDKHRERLAHEGKTAETEDAKA